jgi:hypothetical protein
MVAASRSPTASRSAARSRSSNAGGGVDIVITDEELEELEIRTVGDVVRATNEIRG